jgi:sec-independent protein translocase protein TatC
MSTKPEAEDMFEDTRMSFGDHLEELRLYLWRAIFGFLIALVFSFFIGKYVLQIISQPVEKQLLEFYARRSQGLADDLNRGDEAVMKYNEPIQTKISLPAWLFTEQVRVKASVDGKATAFRLTDKSLDALRTEGVPKEVLDKLGALKDKEFATWEAFSRQLATVLDNEEFDRFQVAVLNQAGRIEVLAVLEDPLRLLLKQNRALLLVTRRPALSTLSIQEAFMAYFKVCIGCALVLGSPWIFYQIWQFVAAGLYPNEKRLVHVYLPVSLSLFLAGVVICQLLVIPKAIEALLWFNEWLGLEPEMRFNEWLGFAIMMPLVFGISFQLPLVMMFLERIGIFTVEQFKRQWKIAFFVIHVFAAIITPSVDMISMELLALPMFGLYWLGIVLCRVNRRSSDIDVDVPDAEDMVEV